MYIRKSLNSRTKAAGFEIFANWLLSTKRPKPAATPNLAPPAGARVSKIPLIALLFSRPRA